MAGPLQPMKAVSGPLPTDTGWAYEVKWDGMRAVASVDEHGQVEAWSGRGASVMVRYPELEELAAAAQGHAVVVDGEVVVLDESGRANFSRLQGRMHVEKPERVALLRREVQVHYVVFDLLCLDGTDTFELPYTDRRSLLHQVIEPQPHVLVPEHVVDQGPVMFEAARAQGLEGLMAKRLESTYLPGRRSTSWRKCKVRLRQEVVIGGWASGEGTRSGGIGSLLVGVHDPDEPGRPLLFAGGVGTGLNDAALHWFQHRLAELATDECPFATRPPRLSGRTMHWVEPVLVAEVEFGEWTPEGRMRHPSYFGLRDDKDPMDVVREPVGSAGG